jgi:hypothetical protein
MMFYCVKAAFLPFLLHSAPIQQAYQYYHMIDIVFWLLSPSLRAMTGVGALVELGKKRH